MGRSSSAMIDHPTFLRFATLITLASRNALFRAIEALGLPEAETKNGAAERLARYFLDNPSDLHRYQITTTLAAAIETSRRTK
jgi:hypothetical protein